MSYLTTAEYLARFGTRETTLLTNEADPVIGVPPTYDSAKVDNAIADASDEVDRYIATRYAVPLASPEPIVRGWVAVIARFNLATASGRMNDAIKDAMDRVTRQLEQLAAGKLNLTAPPGGEAPGEVSAGDAVSSNDAPCPTLGSLDAFTAPFTPYGYDCVPAWRRGC
jgi:phage gp36-like protein